MRVYVGDASVFGVGHRHHYAELRRLLLRAAQGQHLLVVADVDALLSSDFFAQAAAPIDRPEWTEVLERAAFAADIEDRDTEPGQAPGHPFAFLVGDRVHVGESGDLHAAMAHCAFVLTPAESGEWAEQPLRLLLENTRDWLLIECMARAFSVASIEDAYLRGWLVPDGRGGAGEVLVTLRARQRLDRLFAFADSDRTNSCGAPSATAAAIAAECAVDPRVPFHLTERRETENYIPTRLLNDLVHARRRKDRGARQRLREWLALSEDERHHDDVRARFGDALTDEALDEMRRCPLEWLANAGGAEIRQALAHIEDHL